MRAASNSRRRAIAEGWRVPGVRANFSGKSWIATVAAWAGGGLLWLSISLLMPCGNRVALSCSFASTNISELTVAWSNISHPCTISLMLVLLRVSRRNLR